jgi:hypothetical protein
VSRRRKVRRSVRWARYFNHYGHRPDVVVGGWAAVRAMNVPGMHWKYIRRQAKHRFGES